MLRISFSSRHAA